MQSLAADSPATARELWQRHIAIQHAGYFLLDYCSTHPFRMASREELDGIVKQIHAAHAQQR